MGTSVPSLTCSDEAGADGASDMVTNWSCLTVSGAASVSADLSNSTGDSTDSTGDSTDAHIVQRISCGCATNPKRSRVFHTHWAMICQNSWPQGVREHQRSGSCSASSSLNTCSNEPRCWYSSSMVAAGRLEAGCEVRKSS